MESKAVIVRLLFFLFVYEEMDEQSKPMKTTFTSKIKSLYILPLRLNYIMIVHGSSSKVIET